MCMDRMLIEQSFDGSTPSTKTPVKQSTHVVPAHAATVTINHFRIPFNANVRYLRFAGEIVWLAAMSINQIFVLRVPASFPLVKKKKNCLIFCYAFLGAL